MEPVDGMADEAGYPAPFLRHPSSPDSRQGGTISRRVGTGSPGPRASRTGASSELAGQLPTGVQPVPRQNYDRLSNQVHKPVIQFGSFTCKTDLMLRPLRIILVLYSRFFHSRRDLLLENLALRQQLGVLQRRRPQPRFGISDKFFWVILRRLWPGWNRALILIQPETVVRWHRAG